MTSHRRTSSPPIYSLHATEAITVTPPPTYSTIDNQGISNTDLMPSVPPAPVSTNNTIDKLFLADIILKIWDLTDKISFLLR